MNIFTDFNKMITPTIIKVLFWIGIVSSIILGLVEIIGGIIGGEGSLIFTGLITVILGPIFTRIYCELLIIIFKIYELLKEISSKLDSKNSL